MIRHPTNYDTVPGLTPILYTSMAIDQIGSQLDVSKIQPKVSLSAHGQQTTKILVYPTNWVSPNFRAPHQTAIFGVSW